MKVGIIEGDSGRNVFGIFELSDAVFESCNGFTQNLRSCLAFAIVVLATVGLLRANTLLASWLHAVAALTKNK